MLLLSRKPNERIVIGGGIELVVLEVRGNRVKLGITAPEDVSISRPDRTPGSRVERSQCDLAGYV